MKKIILIAAIILFGGVGCSAQTPALVSMPAASEDADMVSTTRFQHQKFGYSFLIPQSVAFDTDVVTAPDGNSIKLVQKKSGDVMMTVVVQPGIPGIPLSPDKIESVVVGGVTGHIYHDTDQADGGKNDKLIVDFPDGKNTVYIAAPESPAFTQIDLKAAAATWKWKK